MDALFLHSAFDARIGKLNLETLKEKHCVVRVAAVGLCGSDLHYYKDGGIGGAQIRSPFVPGHEFSGWLEDDIPSLGLKRRTLVSVDPNKSCEECNQCKKGYPNLCPNVEFIGAPPFNGAMTERISVPISQIVPIPQSMTPAQGVMLEPLGVAIHAVDLAKPKLLETVAVLGCGPIGLLIIQVLRVSGVGSIIAIDPLEHRRNMAIKLGANISANSTENISNTLFKNGAPLVIEATNSPFGFKDAVLASEIGGRIIIVGIPDGDQYTLPAAEARRRGLKIKFSRRMGNVYPRAVELVVNKRVDVDSMVTNKFSLMEAPSAFKKHADNEIGLIKSLIIP